MKIRRFIAVAVCGLAWSTLPSTSAWGQNLILGGTQIGAYSNFSYLGYLYPLQGRLGQGWYVIGLANYLNYRYNTGYPTITVAKSPTGPNGRASGRRRRPCVLAPKGSSREGKITGSIRWD